MTARSIILNAREVRSLSAGHVQIRRAVKRRPGICDACWAKAMPHNREALVDASGAPNAAGEVFGTDPYLCVPACEHNDVLGARIRCPLGAVGARLWVKERWVYFGGTEYLYLRDAAVVRYPDDLLPLDPIPGGRWLSAAAMPKWASRLTAEIDAERGGRIQDITNAEARALGIREWGGDEPGDYRGTFRDLWSKAHGERSWDRNDWVWILDLKRIDGAAERA